jgi:uncharacterized membrane protein YdjX (TVP38/TMEM64 family)
MRQAGERCDSAFVDQWLRALVPLAIIALVTLGGIRLLGHHRMQTLVETAGVWAPIIFIALKVLTFVVAPLSGAPLKIVAGTVFGFSHGALYSVVGDTIGGSINFLIARKWGWRVVESLLRQETAERVRTLSLQIGSWRELIWARLFLTPIYDFVSYAMGLTRIQYRVFVVVTALGAFLPAALFAWLGTTTTQHTRWLDIAYSAITVVAVCGVAAAIVRRRVIRRRQPPA